ncbi:hypothetical protein ACIBCC_29965 [Streptomyces griseus]|uniref:hypothetical protein n=1 Tax=Streptomyces griseus TaxID=1911 RepID=UPI00379DEDB9
MAAMPQAGFTYSSTRITPPDYKKIVEDAEKDARRVIASRIRKALRPANPGVTLPAPILLNASLRPDLLLVEAANVVRQADAEIALWSDERNKALGSLWFYDQVLGLDQASGVTKTAYREILSKVLFGDAKVPLPATENNNELEILAESRGVAGLPHEEAIALLLEAAPLVVAARARRRVAVVYLQDAALALSEPPYEWDPDRIADHADIARKLVYKLKDAAAKRRDK